MPDEGSLYFEANLKRLASHGNEGWFVVEAKQDLKFAPLIGMARVRPGGVGAGEDGDGNGL